MPKHLLNFKDVREKHMICSIKALEIAYLSETKKKAQPLNTAHTPVSCFESMIMANFHLLFELQSNSYSIMGVLYEPAYVKWVISFIIVNCSNLLQLASLAPTNLQLQQ